MLAGLMSRWMTPWPWAQSSASQTAATSSAESRKGTEPAARRTLRVVPWTNSSTR